MLRTPGRLRSAIVLLCLWAFAVQAYIAQTHVHAPPAQAAAVSTLHADLQGSPGEGQGGEPACLLCKVALHGSAVAFVPHLVVFVPADVSAAAVPDLDQSLRASTLAHHWQSRGPPLS